MAWVNANMCAAPRSQSRSIRAPSRHSKHQNAENGSSHNDDSHRNVLAAPATALSMFVSDLFAVAAAPIDQSKPNEPTLVKLHRNDPREAWGFRLQGGSEYKTQLAIKLVKPNTPASQSLNSGDLIVSINGTSSRGLTHDDATEIIKKSGTALNMEVIKYAILSNSFCLFLLSRLLRFCHRNYIRQLAVSPPSCSSLI